jgi:hypothetical protein
MVAVAAMAASVIVHRFMPRQSNSRRVPGSLATAFAG